MTTTDRLTDEALERLAAFQQDGKFEYEPNDNYASRKGSPIQGHVIRYNPNPRKNSDGSTSHGLNFPALVASDLLGKADETMAEVAEQLNACPALARELLAHRRASQAAPGGCGYPCGYDCNGACFQAAPAPSDELAEIDAMLMNGQGDDDGDQVLPDFEPGWSVAAKVEACLHLLEKRRDVIAAPAPSDGLREAWIAGRDAAADTAAYRGQQGRGLINADYLCEAIRALNPPAALTPAPAQEGGE